MRIAQVAPLFETVPPTAYGGTERVVSYLTESLVEMGHDVTLFASGDSRTGAQLVPIVERSLPPDLYRFKPQAEDYFAFVGRTSPEKRVDRAIAIAKATGVKLKIAAKVDRADKAYFDREIAPLLDDPLIEFVGEIGEDQKGEFIGNARALLFPIDWPEPFGLVMIEAMACGTPVIAFRCGSVPEILDHGKTGFIVDDMEQAVEAARRVGDIDRRGCRDVFEQRFTARQMASRYLEVYSALSAARGPKLGTDNTEAQLSG
jgi:glycosyltransferase involved in cell wall biosynthesis